jgi:hypothetical protein
MIRESSHTGVWNTIAKSNTMLNVWFLLTAVARSIKKYKKKQMFYLTGKLIQCIEKWFNIT